MEEDSAECSSHGCLFLFLAESFSAWQCTTSSSSNCKLNVINSFSRCCGSERREAYNSQNNCRSAGNAGPYTFTTVVVTSMPQVKTTSRGLPYPHCAIIAG